MAVIDLSGIMVAELSSAMRSAGFKWADPRPPLGVVEHVLYDGPDVKIRSRHYEEDVCVYCQVRE